MVIKVNNKQPPNAHPFDGAKLLLLKDITKFKIGKRKSAKCSKSAFCGFFDWENYYKSSIYTNKFNKNVRICGEVVPNLRAVVYLNFPIPL